MEDMFGIPLVDNHQLWEAIDAVIDAVLFNMPEQTRSIITYGGFTCGEFSGTLTDIPIVVITKREPTAEDENQALRIKSYLERDGNPLLKNVHLYFIPETAIAGSRKGRGIHIEDTYASRFESYPLGPEDDFWITRYGMVLHGENILGNWQHTTCEALLEKLSGDLEYISECLKDSWPFNGSTTGMPRKWQVMLARWVFWILGALALAKKQEPVTMKEASELFQRENYPERWKSYVSDFVAFRDKPLKKDENPEQQSKEEHTEEIIEHRHVKDFPEFYSWFSEYMKKEFRIPPQ